MTADWMEQWRTDPETSRAGVWVEAGQGVAFRVARMGGHNMDWVLRVGTAPLAEDATTLEQFNFNCVCMANALVMEWRGLPNEYDRAQLASDLQSSPELMGLLSGVSTDRDRFLVDTKSPDPVGGTSEADGGDRPPAGNGRPTGHSVAPVSGGPAATA